VMQKADCVFVPQTRCVDRTSTAPQTESVVAGWPATQTWIVLMTLTVTPRRATASRLENAQMIVNVLQDKFAQSFSHACQAARTMVTAPWDSFASTVNVNQACARTRHFVTMDNFAMLSP